MKLLCAASWQPVVGADVCIGHSVQPAHCVVCSSW